MTIPDPPNHPVLQWAVFLALAAAAVGLVIYDIWGH
jgi:hypothetical protein